MPENFDASVVEALKAPLDRSNVKERSQAGRTLSYVEGWHVIAEANRIFGFGGWDRETIDLRETNRDLVTLTGRNNEAYQQWRVGYIAKVRVTVGSVVREGTGYGSGMGKPEGIGDAVEGAIKEAETDAMKRALMTFGNPFGLALYDKQQANVAEFTGPATVAPPAAPATNGKPMLQREKKALWGELADELRACETPEKLDALAGSPRFMQEAAKLKPGDGEHLQNLYDTLAKDFEERAGRPIRPPNFDSLEPSGIPDDLPPHISEGARNLSAG